MGISTPVTLGRDIASPNGSSRRDVMTIIFASLALFIPGLGNVHLFDWDEINFAEAAREMLITHDYLHVRVDFLPFAEKPPLFMWLQVISMRIFGVSEFSARLPNVIVGVFALIALYFVGCQLRDRRFGMLWVLTFIGSFFPHLYFRSGLIDPLFNGFIFAGICALFAARQKLLSQYSEGALRLFAIAGSLIGLAVLTKGPVALLLVGITTVLFLWVRRSEFSPRIFIKPVFLFTAGVAVTSLPWYVAVALSDGGHALGGFVARQIELLRTGVAGHSGPWYYHIIVLLVGCFPASVFAFAGVRRIASQNSVQEKSFDDFRLWMLLLFGTVVVIFSIVQTKIVHYSSLAYFPISFFAANALYRRVRFSSAFLAALLSIATLWGVALTSLPLIGLHAAALSPYVRDAVARAALQLPVRWSYADTLIGIAYLVAMGVAVAWILELRANTSEVLRSTQSTAFDAPVLLIFAATASTLFATILVLVPKVEAHSQGTPIAFYEGLRGRDFYVTTLAFKSYAQLYYTNKDVETARREQCGAAHYADSLHLRPGSSIAHEEWLLHGAIDRIAYFVAKVDKVNRWRSVPGLHELSSSGGFTFFGETALCPRIPRIAPWLANNYANESCPWRAAPHNARRSYQHHPH